MQAVMFLVDWTPSDSQEILLTQLSASTGAFQSLEQATELLQILIAQVMRLRNTEQELSPEGKMSPLSASFKGVVLKHLESWSSLFENILQQDNSPETTSMTRPLVSLLRLQHTVAWTFLRSHDPRKEMGYDSFLPQFQQGVALAREVAAAHQRYSGSLKPTFTPEIRIVPVLYLIGVKCRDPIARREVQEILRWQPIQEAVWDSISTGKVVERVIEIEESRLKGREMIQSMEQMPAWKRIEAMSWVRSTARMDIKYTFCAREGIHMESLMI